MLHYSLPDWAQILGGLSVLGGGAYAVHRFMRTATLISFNVERIVKNDLPHIYGEIAGLRKDFTDFLIREGTDGKDSSRHEGRD